VTQDNIVKFAEPGTFEDPLTEVLRSGARKLLAQAIEAEISDFLDRHSRFLTEEGQQRLVRHGHLPEREIMTGIGPVGVRAPRVRDRAGEGEARIRFSSAILPPYARRSKSLEVLIQILYLKGISTGDFEEALAALLGKDAGRLSASTVARLKDAWVDEHLRWSRRDLAAKRYVYFWVDGIYVQARLEDDAQCLLVINVLNKLPKSQQARAKRALEEIWMAETKKDGVDFGERGECDESIKYEKAVECLTKDREALLLLRLPSRALEASAHVEPRREHIRDRAPPNDTREGMPIEQNWSRHGLQACSSGGETWASPRWKKPIAKGRSRSKVH
jgi:Transposase, Mutator family